MLQVPSKYIILLCLNTRLSKEQSKMVFTLTETCLGSEFSTQTFTIEELEQNFYASFS